MTECLCVFVDAALWPAFSRTFPALNRGRNPRCPVHRELAQNEGDTRLTKPTKEQIARAVEILRKEGIDTAEKFEALLAASEARYTR